MAEEEEGTTYIHTLCEEQPQIVTAYFVYVIPLLNAFAIVSIICGTFVYVRAFRNGTFELNKALFYCILALFCLLIATCVAQTVLHVLFCDRYYYYVISPFLMSLYNVKTIVFVGILFWRVQHSFKDSSFQLSRCSFLFFAICYTLVCLTGSTSVVMFIFGEDTFKFGYMFAGVTLTLVSLLTVYLVALFIYKLNQTYATFRVSVTASSDPGLVYIMTKIALLFFLSTLALLSVVVIQSVANSVNSIHFTVLGNVLIIIDVLLNFLCVLLSLKHFEKLYMKLCGCCHSKCQVMCDKGGDAKAQRVGSQSQLALPQIATTSSNSKSPSSSINLSTPDVGNIE